MTTPQPSGKRYASVAELVASMDFSPECQEEFDRLQKESWPTVEEITHRISDPGKFTPRGNNYMESLSQWGARAVLLLLKEKGLIS